MNATLGKSIRAIDIRNASQADYIALSNFSNQMRAERLPDDPPRSLEETIQQAQNIPPVIDLPMWVVDHPEGQGIIAYADIEIIRLEENKHMASFSIDVLPEFRDQGLELELLHKIVEVAEQEGRSLLMGTSNNRVPSGAALMQSIGAEMALESHTNQLDLQELNRSLIDQWIHQAKEKSAGFELQFWEGPYPEEDLQAFCHLYDVLNSAPRGNLQMEDFHFSPELMRQMEQMIFATGNKRWTLMAVEQATGRFAGYTEIQWNPKRPQIMVQQGTGVYPEFRNLGLGRWLKAAMLERVLRQQPEARFVRTGNADSNAPMLKINHQLGFMPYIAQASWQIETAKVRGFLQRLEVPRPRS
jgi:GNAT superfamily N-acetyltransferase